MFLYIKHLHITVMLAKLINILQNLFLDRFLDFRFRFIFINQVGHLPDVQGLSFQPFP